MKIKYLKESFEEMNQRLKDQIKSIDQSPSATEVQMAEKEKRDKNIEDAMKDIPDAKNAEVKSEAEEVKVPEPLKEGLSEDYNVREYSDMLFDMIEAGEVDAKHIAEDLIYWCSEDDIRDYMRVNDIIPEEQEDDLEEGCIKESFVDTLTDEQKEKIWDVANQFVTSNPVSGSWDTEDALERSKIAELGYSDEEVDAIMKDLLGNEVVEESACSDEVSESCVTEAKKPIEYGKANLIVAELDAGTDINSEKKLKFNYQEVPKKARYKFHDVHGNEGSGIGDSVEVSLDNLDLVVHSENVDFARKVAEAYEVPFEEDNDRDLQHYQTPHTLRFKFQEDDWGDEDLD